MRILVDDNKTYTIDEKKTTSKKVALKNTDKMIKMENIVKVIYYDEVAEKDLFVKIFKEIKEETVTEEVVEKEINC